MKNNVMRIILFSAIAVIMLFFSSHAYALTMSGSETITASGSSQYTASGCSGTVTWGVTNPGASINPTSGNQITLTTNNACGTVLLSAKCAADGKIATKSVRVTDGGQWVLILSEDWSPYNTCYNSCSPLPNICTYFNGELKVELNRSCCTGCGSGNTNSCVKLITNDPCNWVCDYYARKYICAQWRKTYEWRCSSSSSCAYNITPQAQETCGDLKDNNCNGQVDEGCPSCVDNDGDGRYAISPSCPQGDDPADDDATVYPGAPEKCDLKDNDCDGQKDENCQSCGNSTTMLSNASLSTGNYNHTQDVFGITLIYDSRRTLNGTIGKGWTHSYDTKIKIDTDGSLEFMEDGVATNFRLSGSIYKAEQHSGMNAGITKNADNTYTLTRKDGIVYQFNSQGKLASITDRNSNRTTLTYTNNNLSSTTDAVGRITSLTYNSSGRLTQITDFAGRTTTLSYNPSGLLSTVTNPDGSSWAYNYDASGRMTSKTDPLGYANINTYDASGRMIKATDAVGKIKTISYDNINKTSTVTEWDGGVWQYKYDDLLNVQTEIKDPNGNIRTKTYNANKNLLSETDPQGNIATYTYDTSGNMTSVKDAAGNITSYTYNTFGQATSVTTPDNKTTSYAYDSKGNLTSTTDSGGAVTQYQYDTKGNVIKAISPQLSAISYTYDQYNNPVSITDSTGAATTFTYDISGNTTSVTDSQGNTTRFEYNSQNQIVKVIDSSGNATSSAYDAMGNRTSQTDANGNTTRYEYNYKGQITKVIDALGGITTYEYGGTGCSSCSGGTDKLTALTDAVGNRTAYGYDLLGRLIKETDTDGKVITYSYDSAGNLISKTDAAGITINYAYDSLKRLTGIIFPDSSQNISYTYDSSGKVFTIADPSGTTAYDYDLSNRLIKEAKTIEGKSFNVSYNYSLVGALTSITYPSGRIVSYEYDPIGRVIRVTEEKDGKRSEIIKNIIYLPNGAISSITQGNNIVTTKTYDNRNQLSSLSIGNLKQLSYTRDNIGNITAINDLLDPTKTKTYAYDALYRLTQAVGPWGTIQYNYDPVGNRLIENSSSGVTNYSYSSNKLVSSTGAKSFNFSYDNNGNTISENQKQYIYNQNQRLIKAVENGNTLGEYLYNANGQRVKKTVDGKTAYFIYDQSGNLMEEADETGQVNADYVYLGSVPISRVDEWWENMPMPQAPEGITIVPGDTQLTVSWNPNSEPTDGYKVYWGVESGKYTSSVDVGKVTAYTITNLANGISYYIAVKAYIDIKETYYYHTDHIGTPILMSDKNGFVVWSGEFLPFGEPLSITGSVINNKRLPGQYYDKETGKHDNGFRTYNPFTDTYLQRDPIGFEGGDTNLYLYAKANPIRFADPFGLTVKLCSRTLKAFGNKAPQLGKFRHEFLWINGTTYGFTLKNDDDFPNGPGWVAPNDDWDVNYQRHDGRCYEVQCINEELLLLNIEKDRNNPPYYQFFGFNCQKWASSQLKNAKLVSIGRAK